MSQRLIERALHDAAVAPPQGGPASAPARTLRILREMADYYRHPHPSVEIYPCEDRYVLFSNSELDFNVILESISDVCCW